MLNFITLHGGAATYAQIRDGLGAESNELDAALRGMIARKAVVQTAAGFHLFGYRPGADIVDPPDVEEPPEPEAPDVAAERVLPVAAGKRLCLTCQKMRPTWYFEGEGVECKNCLRKRKSLEFAARRRLPS